MSTFGRNRKKNSKIVLASASLARKKLMEELKIPFQIYPSGYHEKMTGYKNVAQLAKFLALEKAKSVANKFPDAIIIGADTFIVVGEKIIGKPKNITDAKKIIKSMSGKTIKVYTGIAVIKTGKTSPTGNNKLNKVATDHAITKLKICKITTAEANKLAHHPKATKIAGGFSIEGEGGKLIEKIDGDYDNVMGLPMTKLKKLLIKLQ